MRDSEVSVRFGHRDSSSWCATHEPDSHQVWLNHTLNRIGFFAYRNRERRESDRAAPELTHQRFQNCAVKAVEPDG